MSGASTSWPVVLGRDLMVAKTAWRRSADGCQRTLATAAAGLAVSVLCPLLRSLLVVGLTAVL
jgi:hypothetical protein